MWTGASMIHKSLTYLCSHHLIDLCTYVSLCVCVCFCVSLLINSVSDCIFRPTSGVTVFIFTLTEMESSLTFFLNYVAATATMCKTVSQPIGMRRSPGIAWKSYTGSLHRDGESEWGISGRHYPLTVVVEPFLVTSSLRAEKAFLLLLVKILFSADKQSPREAPLANTLTLCTLLVELTYSISCMFIRQLVQWSLT